MTKRILNLKRAPKDERDLKFATIALDHFAEPSHVDLRTYDMPIVDQGEIGSCTAQSWTAHHDFLRKQAMRNKGTFRQSSRMFLYNMERKAAGTFNEDAGANMRDGGDVLHDIGVIPESSFKYVPSNLYKLPTEKMISDASAFKNSLYYAVDSMQEMRSCLISGFPFVFGFDVPVAFMDDTMANTGAMSLKDWASKADGGHAVMCVGYDDNKQSFLVRNSWGTSWGMKGYFWMPYSMASAGEAYDHYTLRL